MAVGPARIETLEAGDALLAAGSLDQPLVVPVRDVVPGWLSELIVEVHQRGGTVVVSAEPPPALTGESLDGWEIGICTAALRAGVDQVTGVSTERMRRVRAVLDSLERAAAAGTAPDEAAS